MIVYALLCRYVGVAVVVILCVAGPCLSVMYLCLRGGLCCVVAWRYLIYGVSLCCVYL